ncbi:MAG TPA: universal stress protein [Streptosporangiaceae bacterium]|nr:universal stress protein [Streptosporangiaceae bacterium]
MPGPILAAVDGSQPSLHALDWAADEAALRRAPLQIVHVALTWSYQAPATPGGAGAAPDDAGLRVLDAAAQRAASRYPDIGIETQLLVGPAAATLLPAAASARLVVLGRRGAAGFAGQLLGSISYQVAAHAACPVAVIPAPEDVGRDQAQAAPDRAHADIVVGVDGGQNTADAVAFAFEEAVLRGAKLRAIHSWTHALAQGAGDSRKARSHEGASHAKEAMAAQSTRMLAESVASWREKYPDVRLTEQVERGHAAKILTDASATAGLLVVGAHGKGGFPGLALGSVTHSVLHHAHCPVVVVRPLP